MASCANTPRQLWKSRSAAALEACYLPRGSAIALLRADGRTTPRKRSGVAGPVARSGPFTPTRLSGSGARASSAGLAACQTPCSSARSLCQFATARSESADDTNERIWRRPLSLSQLPDPPTLHSAPVSPQTSSPGGSQTPHPLSPCSTRSTLHTAQLSNGHVRRNQSSFENIVPPTRVEPPSWQRDPIFAGPAGVDLLREQIMCLKAELNETSAEARRYKQRFVHLEGDIQGKVQWMLQWERQIVAKAVSDTRTGDVGPSGLGWPAWKAFADRSATESQKTQRLLTRSANLEVHQKTHDELQEEVREVATALSEAETQLRDEEIYNARLAGVIRRRREGARDKLRKRDSVDALRREFSLCGRERARLMSDEAAQERCMRILRGEFEEAVRRLNEAPAQQHKKRIQRACARKGEMDAQMRNFGEEASVRDTLAAQEQSQELGELRSSLAMMDTSMQTAAEEACALSQTLVAVESSVALDQQEEAMARQRAVDLARSARSDAIQVRKHEKRRADAAVHIQSRHRGCQVRREMARLNRDAAVLQRRLQIETAAAIDVQRHLRGRAGGGAGGSPQGPSRRGADSGVHSWESGRMSPGSHKQKGREASQRNEEAVHVEEFQLSRVQTENVAAVKLQSAYRGGAARKVVRARRESMERERRTARRHGERAEERAAAVKLQRLYRRRAARAVERS